MSWKRYIKNTYKDIDYRKMGIVRSTFIIDQQGTVIDAEYGVKADGHAQAVLDKIKAI